MKRQLLAVREWLASLAKTIIELRDYILGQPAMIHTPEEIKEMRRTLDKAIRECFKLPPESCGAMEVLLLRQLIASMRRAIEGLFLDMEHASVVGRIGELTERIGYGDDSAQLQLDQLQRETHERLRTMEWFGRYHEQPQPLTKTIKPSPEFDDPEEEIAQEPTYFRDCEAEEKEIGRLVDVDWITKEAKDGRRIRECGSQSCPGS